MLSTSWPSSVRPVGPRSRAGRPRSSGVRCRTEAHVRHRWLPRAPIRADEARGRTMTPSTHERGTAMATAAPIQTDTFTGFTPEAIQFLVDLADNNDRAWFNPRKAEYERLLKRPLEALCVALDERFKARDIPLEADPARSPFRIYRDVRFAKDKSPYKTHISASFAYVGGNPHGGGYFHFQPGEMHIGGGLWRPEPATLAAFRRLVDKGEGLEPLDDQGF